MKISDSIESFIREMFKTEESIELKRNELAVHFNCVPSQINYVISTRFTTQHGYIVESRRGGGGYIKITRILLNDTLNIINSIGNNLDIQTVEAIVTNLIENDIITQREAKLILASCLNSLSIIKNKEVQDTVRSQIFKNILINLA